MFEREERAFLQWPFMPCEKYMSLLVQLMKALSCPPPVEVYRDGLSGAHTGPSVAHSTLWQPQVSQRKKKRQQANREEQSPLPLFASFCSLSDAGTGEQVR